MKIPFEVISGVIIVLSVFFRECAGGEVSAGVKPYMSPAFRIEGLVFEDNNKNGLRDETEKGIPGVIVSDGDNVTAADRDGHYKLEAATNSPCFVFITVPDGYVCAQKFYQPAAPSAIKTNSFDFGLVKTAETNHSDFSFVQITDVHMGYFGDDHESFFKKDLAEISALAPKCAFVAVTGDLVDIGERRNQWDLFKDGIGGFELPLYFAKGNHEIQNGNYFFDYRIKFYENFFGPSYYSFDYGSFHFVVLDKYMSFAKLSSWFQKDMSFQPKNKPTIIFQHEPPTEGSFAFLSQFGNVKAVFFGDFHRSATCGREKIIKAGSPPFCFGGSDYSPRRFRIISIHGDQITDFSERALGQKERLVIVSPAPDVACGKNDLKVIVSAYDTCADVTQVECRLDGGNWVGMSAFGKRTWQLNSTIPGDSKGAHTITAKAKAKDGRTWEHKSTFKVSGQSRPLPRPESEWPMFRKDAVHSGTTAAVHPPLYLAWCQNTGGIINRSSPVISGNSVYIGVEDEDGTGQQGIVAMNAVNGEILWKYKTDSSIKGTPLLDRKVVYALSAYGTLYALNAITGEGQWSCNLQENESMRGICGGYGSPVIDNGVIYLGFETNFAAFDEKTGNKLWNISVSNPIVGSVPVITDNKIFICPQNGVYALSKSAGKEIWKKNNMQYIYSSPAYDGNAVYVIDKEHAYALDAKTGSELWKVHLPIWGISSPSIAGSVLYIGSGTGAILALDAASGAKLWDYQTKTALMDMRPYQRGGSCIISSPAMSENTVYIGSNDGSLYAFDAKTGSKIWSYDLGTPVASSPAISGNTVYVGAFDGNVYAFTSEKNNDI